MLRPALVNYHVKLGFICDFREASIFIYFLDRREASIWLVLLDSYAYVASTFSGSLLMVLCMET